MFVTLLLKSLKWRSPFFESISIVERSRVATVVRDWISKAAKSDHRIGRLDAVGQQRWKKQQGPLSGIRVGNDRGDLDCSEFICFEVTRTAQQKKESVL